MVSSPIFLFIENQPREEELYVSGGSLHFNFCPNKEKRKVPDILNLYLLTPATYSLFIEVAIYSMQVHSILEFTTLDIIYIHLVPNDVDFPETIGF